MGTSITSEVTGSNMMVCFRTAYLKSIAQAWEDPQFMARLKNGKNILDWSGFLRNMAGNEHCYQNEATELQDGYGFRCLEPAQVKHLPWTARVVVRDYSEGPIFERSLTAGWMGGHDRFFIVIPPKPENPEDYPAAIAAYLQQYPTILGYKPQQESCQWDFSSGEPGFLALSNLLALAIPFCWTNMTIAELRRNIGDHTPGSTWAEQHSFIDLLTTDLFEEQGFKALADYPSVRGAQLLSTYFGFNNQWNFNFAFLNGENLNQALGANERRNWTPIAQRMARALCDEHGEYHPIRWDSEKKEWRNLFNVVELNLPCNPCDDVVAGGANNPNHLLVRNIVRANALAVYNDSMAHYPFSCP